MKLLIPEYYINFIINRNEQIKLNEPQKDYYEELLKFGKLIEEEVIYFISIQNSYKWKFI